ncbi:hypothetical protein FXW31_02405 [Candidatus Liberibacter asiaticus]|nr:hypothetical protein FXW31_02405 [Candidatus Liberibacter asiaticus]
MAAMSVPPLFSVNPNPIATEVFCIGALLVGSYSRENILGAQSLCTLGVVINATIDALVTLGDIRCPASN